MNSWNRFKCPFNFGISPLHVIIPTWKVPKWRWSRPSFSEWARKHAIASDLVAHLIWRYSNIILTFDGTLLASKKTIIRHPPGTVFHIMFPPGSLKPTSTSQSLAHVNMVLCNERHKSRWIIPPPIFQSMPQISNVCIISLRALSLTNSWKAMIVWKPGW